MKNRKATRVGRPRKSGKPEKITHKGLEATIQLREVAGKAHYRIRYYQAGERKDSTALTLEAARTKAISILSQMSDTSGTVAFPADQAAAINMAAGQLREINRTLVASVNEYVQAIKMLPAGHTLAAAVQEYIANIEKEKLIPITLPDMIKQYLEYQKEHGLRPRALRDITDRLNRTARHIEGYIANIQPVQINDFLKSLQLAPRTLNNYRGALVGLFTYAKAHNYLPSGVETAAERSGTYKADTEEVAFYDPETVKLALEKLPEQWRAMVAIGAFAGVRQSEIHTLDWSRVDLKNREIVIEGAKAKTRARRSVPIQPNLAGWLKPLAKKSGLVIPDYASTNTLARGFSTIWDEVMPAGTKRILNGLRHSFGTYRLKILKNESALALEMGNSPQMVFQYYRGVLCADGRTVTESMAKKYFSIIPSKTI